MTTRITPWNRIPVAYREYAHDPLWTRYGQFVAGKMIRFVMAALGLKRRVVFPRIVAYPGVQRKNPSEDGNPSIPVEDAGGIFYGHHNVIVLRRPWKRNNVKVNEYHQFKHSPVIGATRTSGRRAFLMDLAHEVAHWFVDRVMKLPNEPVHGLVWRSVYALIREQFTNGKRQMPQAIASS